jgi:hypothetical protein
MIEALKSENQAAKADARTGGEVSAERWINHHLGNVIHLFLSLLALLIFVAALVTTFDTAVRDFPKLFQQINEYSILQEIIQTISCPANRNRDEHYTRLIAHAPTPINAAQASCVHRNHLARARHRGSRSSPALLSFRKVPTFRRQ